MSALFGAVPMAPRVCKVTERFKPEIFEYRPFFVRLERRETSNGDAPSNLYVGSEATYTRGAQLGKGAYGVVYRYDLKRGDPDKFPPAFSVKVTQDEAEIAAVGHIQTDAALQKMFPWTIISTFVPPKSNNTKPTYCVAMPLFDGDLSKLTGAKLRASEIVNIGVNILRFFHLIHKKKLYYLDVKALNCLYFACGDSDIVPTSITMGDVGSITSAKDYLVTTNPSPEYAASYAADYNAKKLREDDIPKFMCWALAATLLEFVNPDSYKLFYHENINALLEYFKTHRTGGNSATQEMRTYILRKTRGYVQQANRAELMPVLKALMGDEQGPPQLAGGFAALISKFEALESKLDSAAMAPQSSLLQRAPAAPPGACDAAEARCRDCESKLMRLQVDLRAMSHELSQTKTELAAAERAKGSAGGRLAEAQALLVAERAKVRDINARNAHMVQVTVPNVEIYGKGELGVQAIRVLYLRPDGALVSMIMTYSPTTGTIDLSAFGSSRVHGATEAKNRILRKGYQQMASLAMLGRFIASNGTRSQLTEAQAIGIGEDLSVNIGMLMAMDVNFGPTEPEVLVPINALFEKYKAGQSTYPLAFAEFTATYGQLMNRYA